jgi:polyisoprenoid-binding protein YceI
MRRAALAALLLLPAAARAQTTRYKVSAPAPEACRPGLNGELPPACASFVRITVKTYLFDVVGYFRDFGGEIVLDRKRPRASRVEMKARTASVDTGIAFRDEHLREGDFFDCGAFPEAVFVSTGIAVIDARSFDLMG